MAYNQNMVQVEEVIFTSTSLTLGFDVGMTVPPRYLVCNPTANMTITLPLSTPTLPTSTGGNYVPGAGPGYPITIFNINSGAFTVTIAAASGDTLVNIPVLTSQYASISVFAAPGVTSWYGFNPSTSSSGTSFAGTQIKSDNIGATSTSFTSWIADGAYTLNGVQAVWGTASSAGGTLNFEKATGTTATGSGTAVLTANIATSGTANTVVAGTLVATTATLVFAAGNRFNIILGGTLTSLANCCVSAKFTKNTL